MIMRVLWMGVVTAVVVFLGACATPMVRMDYEQEYDFSRLKSYAIAPVSSGEPAEGQNVPVWATEISGRRVDRELDAALSERGYRRTEPSEADFLVSHGLAVRTVYQGVTQTFWYGSGFYGYYPDGRAFVTSGAQAQDKVGLYIDITDAASKQLIFRGWSSRSWWDTPPKAPDIAERVEEILNAFPPPFVYKAQ